MNEDRIPEKKEVKSRREVLKKAGAFVVPAVTTFKLADLAVAASGQKFSDWADKPDIGQ